MLKPHLQALLSGQSLSTEAMAEAMAIVMDGHATPAQIGALLIALRMKGETPEEIVGAARVMRDRATRVEAPAGPVIDTCGTGGDGMSTFNISTTTAFVVAAAGGIVAKHGNHSNTSRSGSADVLKALGVRIDAGPEVAAHCMRELGLGFLYAPQLHQAMRHAAGPRKELGMRSIFNLLGPLSNPAGAPYQVVGVYDKALVPVLLPALASLGLKGAMVVAGADGMDELTTCAETHVGELRDGELRYYTLDARELGLPRVSADALKGGDPERNAAITRAVLSGEAGPQRDIVLLNAAAALHVAGLAPDMAAGVAMAAEAIDHGRATAKLEALVALSGAAAAPAIA
ncbi:MAG: anthranilate phosphoribosyltransferase [Candidatus Sericytochromatia bacterium]